MNLKSTESQKISHHINIYIIVQIFTLYKAMLKRQLFKI